MQLINSDWTLWSFQKKCILKIESILNTIAFHVVMYNFNWMCWHIHGTSHKTSHINVSDKIWLGFAVLTVGLFKEEDASCRNNVFSSNNRIYEHWKCICRIFKPNGKEMPIAVLHGRRYEREVQANTCRKYTTPVRSVAEEVGQHI